MDADHNTLPDWPGSAEHDLQQDQQSSTETLHDIEAASDSEDELLQHAIMLSLQSNKSESSSGCVGDETLRSNTLTNEVFVNQNRGTADSLFLPVLGSTSSGSSMLLRLPLEIKEIICGFVFDGEDIIVSLRRGTQKFILDWGHHLSIFLSCREIGAIAMRCLRRREVTIDLRQYRRATVGTTSCTAPFLEDLLSQNSSLTSVCTKLVLSQGQHIPSGDLQELIPTLDSVEFYDYVSCRKTIRQTLTYSGRIFEYAVPGMMKAEAESRLSTIQESLPPNVRADLIFVCDTLICIPVHDWRRTALFEDTKTKKRCPHTEGWKSLLKRGVRIPCKKCVEKKGEEYEQGPQYRTAKLRHSILFNEFNPEGAYLSKDWVVAGLGAGPSFSLGDMLAVHCHEYCLELIERGETLGI